MSWHDANIQHVTMREFFRGNEPLHCAIDPAHLMYKSNARTHVICPHQVPRRTADRSTRQQRFHKVDHFSPLSTLAPCDTRMHMAQHEAQARSQTRYTLSTRAAARDSHHGVVGMLGVRVAMRHPANSGASMTALPRIPRGASQARDARHQTSSPSIVGDSIIFTLIS